MFYHLISVLLSKHGSTHKYRHQEGLINTLFSLLTFLFPPLFFYRQELTRIALHFNSLSSQAFENEFTFFSVSQHNHIRSLLSHEGVDSDFLKASFCTLIYEGSGGLKAFN